MKQKLAAKVLLDFILQNRRSGTTNLIKKIAKDEDVYVIVPTMEVAYDLFGDVDSSKIVPISGLINGSHLSFESKPLLVDNFTMIKLLEEFLQHSSTQEKEINDRNVMLSTIHQSINNFANDNHDLRIKEELLDNESPVVSLSRRLMAGFKWFFGSR